MGKTLPSRDAGGNCAMESEYAQKHQEWKVQATFRKWRVGHTQYTSNKLL